MSRLPGHHRARGTAREHRIAKRLLLACSAITLVQAASAQVQTPTADPPLSETSPPVESSIDPHASDPHAPTRHVDMPRNPGALEGVAADGAAKPDGSNAPPATPQRDPQTPSEGVWPWRDETLTGKWGGLRTDLKNAGIDFEASMIFDIVSNFSGGIRTGTDYPHLFNLQLTLDLGKLVGLEGAEIFALGQFEQGQFPSSELVGDFQGVDNIALTTGLAQLSVPAVAAREPSLGADRAARLPLHLRLADRRRALHQQRDELSGGLERLRAVLSEPGLRRRARGLARRAGRTLAR
ncbi:MAG: hypothetical protein ACO38W_01820, partial [Phycisphaerales bacterium]